MLLLCGVIEEDGRIVAMCCLCVRNCMLLVSGWLIWGGPVKRDLLILNLYIRFWWGAIIIVKVISEICDSRSGEDAEDISLVVIEFW